ncbi:MAG: hypothetical protein AB7H66_05385 [Hyphomonadaceae bacterium]
MTAAALGRREVAAITLLWASLAATFVFIHWSAITSLRMPDADDYLRLQQVRDWLAGQAWFDIGQHRVNPPTGGALHWSRIVDLPIAGGIILLTPLVGQPTAEVVVATALPLLLMGAAMFLVAAIAARLVGRAWAPVAAACVPFSAITYPQIIPLRLDHHAWQVVFALTLLWGLTDESNKRRSGMIAGFAAALWLNISIEGLPIITVAAMILSVRWLFDGRELARLQAFLWTLALGSFALETLTMPSAWALAECDRISQPYLAAFAVASLAGAAANLPLLARDWRLRLAFAGVSGLAAGAVFASMGPACLNGPFAALDPLTKYFWLDRVGESLPLFDKGLGAVIAHGGFSLIGCIGAVLAIGATQGEQRKSWITLFVLAFAAGGLMFIISRTGAVAHAFSATGAAFVGMTLLRRARATNMMVVRVLGTVLAIVVATPGLLLPALQFDLRAGPPRRVCDNAYAALNQLPPGLLFAPIDIGPRMIVHTPHSVIATGHHRNHAAMRQVIAAFTGPPEAARQHIAARGADYVVLCPDAPEVRNYVEYAPEGFAGQLVSGRAPGWLRPLDITPEGSGLLVFAVDTNAPAPGDELRGRLAFDAMQAPAL